MIKIVIPDDEEFFISFKRFKRLSAPQKRIMNQKRYFMNKKKRREYKRKMNRFRGF